MRDLMTPVLLEVAITPNNDGLPQIRQWSIIEVAVMTVNLIMSSLALIISAFV